MTIVYDYKDVCIFNVWFTTFKSAAFKTHVTLGYLAFVSFMFYSHTVPDHDATTVEPHCLSLHSTQTVCSAYFLAVMEVLQHV